MSADLRVDAPGLAGMARTMGHAAPDLRKAMKAAVKDAAKPLAAAEKAQALGLDSKASKGGGIARAERAAWYLRNRKKVDDRAVSRAMRTHSGLRAAMANSITVQYSDSGNSAGVTIRARASKMPPSQRTLLRASTSAKGWRHPVYGHKVWVTQRMTPANWWRTVKERELPGVQRKVEAEIGKSFDELARRLSSAG